MNNKKEYLLDDHGNFVKMVKGGNRGINGIFLVIDLDIIN